MRNSKIAFCLGLAMAAMGAPVSVQADDMPVYSVQQGVAISGFDPVSFFYEDAPLLGQDAYTVMWKGVVWRFSSAENQQMFEANPRAFAPKYGGYCAYAMSQGNLMDGNPQHWEIVDGQLYLLFSPAVKDLWLKNRTALQELADDNWPEVIRP